MNAGKAVYGILSANTGVTDIVGTRIFPEIAEQEAATPFVVYQLQSVDPEDTHDGPSKLDEVRFEFICYSDSYNEAADLGTAVRAALDRVSGTYNGVNVESIQFNDVDIDIEYDPRRYSQSLTFTFRIKRDDVEIALGTPVTGAVLGDLSDVNVSGVSDNQVLSYDAASGTWIPANDAGALALGDLSDVSIVTPANGEVVIYSGGEFVNDNLVIGNVSNLQTSLDAKANTADLITTLRDLDDVTLDAVTTGDYLYYNGSAWVNNALILGREGVQYTGNYDTEAEALLDGATATVELYYTAQADGDGLHEDAQSNTPTSGYDIRRKLYYSEAAQADPDTGTWTQFADIADNTTYASAKSTLLAYLKARTGGTVPISLKMTWEEVSQTSYLLDTYTGAAAAYSVRQLRNAQTDCMVIRRASDGTTTTIGFDGSGNIDESAINTFCSGTTCTVATWKDQSGNGNDATQATAGNQPTIYTGGAIVKEKGRMALDFDGIDDALNSSSNVSLPLNNAFALVAKGISTAVDEVLNINNTSGLNVRIQSNNVRVLYTDADQNNVASASNNQFLLYAGRQSSTNTVHGSLDGGAQLADTSLDSGSWNTATGTLHVGARGGTSLEWDGQIQEVIYYESDKLSDRTNIESNIGDYYTQNTPLLDTYSGAAAAYSLRLLDSTYSGSAIRVRRASDNTEQDIGFNVFGELDTVSLASFCSGTDGFVAKWYDQSSNANDATQTTTANQPKIYDSTTGVITENGKPSVEFDGVNDQLPTGVDIRAFTSFAIAAADDDTQNVIFGSATDSNEFLRTETGAARIQNTGGVTVSAITTNQNLIYALNDTTSAIGVNGGTVNTGATQNDSFDSLVIGVKAGAFFYYGRIQEITIYDSDQSSNRTNIEDNINTFYSIY